ncbi:hypothetical protein [Actinomadura flavalba]|uniref:hypothetical protein n=1 Tax=Actinomadura flavalba TaxID=1120938 RepID=UPI00037B520F|nr:hypothetical protein [Actinomadura flavalba]
MGIIATTVVLAGLLFLAALVYVIAFGIESRRGKLRGSSGPSGVLRRRSVALYSTARTHRPRRRRAVAVPAAAGTPAPPVDDVQPLT